MNLEALSSVLSAAILDERTFAAAESLYAESFKDSQTFTVADGHYDRSDLVSYLMEDITEPYQYGMPDWYEPAILKEGYSLEVAEQIVDHVEFVELCNYKGEGEGFVLACRAENLRTFISKHNYA